jgi:hypothetical protein
MPLKYFDMNNATECPRCQKPWDVIDLSDVDEFPYIGGVAYCRCNGCNLSTFPIENYISIQMSEYIYITFDAEGVWFIARRDIIPLPDDTEYTADFDKLLKYLNF